MLVRVIESDWCGCTMRLLQLGFSDKFIRYLLMFYWKIVFSSKIRVNNKQIIINRRNQLVKEGSFNIYRVPHFSRYWEKTAEKIIEKKEEAMERIPNDETASGITGPEKKKK